MKELRTRFKQLGCLLAALLVLSTALPAYCKALIGLNPNAPATAKPPDWGAIMAAEPTNGVRLIWMPFPWALLEPTAGKYNVAALAGLPYLRSQFHFTIAITIQTLDNGNRTVPLDLQTVPFDSPKMKARWEAFLRVMAKTMGPNVHWLMLGNEADVYLGKHPSEVDPYVAFIEHGHDVVKMASPNQLVGVTTTFDGCVNRPTIVSKLQRRMDFVSMTYYPIDGKFHVKPLSDLPNDFAKMIAMAGGKPLFLQGFGCPADPRISSEDIQAAYVSGLFEQLAKYGDKVCAVNWFLLADLNEVLVSGASQYYQQDSMEFREYLGSLGLKRTDGTARKAWNVFRELARNWGAQPPASAAPATAPAAATSAKPAGTGAPAAKATAQPMKPPVRQPGH
jgi:hypothetical protein